MCAPNLRRFGGYDRAKRFRPNHAIPPQFLDELRARLPVSEVVGRRVKLQEGRARVEGAVALQQGEDAVVLRQRPEGAWFDFSSGKNGNIFDFVMQTEGVSFPEAVERLAAMAGVPLPKASPRGGSARGTPQDAPRRRRARGEILRGDAARRAPAPRRAAISPTAGSTPATQLKFRIGYAPAERFALKEHLGAQGVSVEDMVEAGLLVAGEDIPVPYDRFRDRVMFPISDLRGASSPSAAARSTRTRRRNT